VLGGNALITGDASARRRAPVRGHPREADVPGPSIWDQLALAVARTLLPTSSPSLWQLRAFPTAFVFLDPKGHKALAKFSVGDHVWLGFLASHDQAVATSSS